MTGSPTRLATLSVCLFLSLGLMACGGGSPPPAREIDEASPAERVTALADTYVDEYFKAFPFKAPLAGAEDLYPDLIGDHSLAALAGWNRREDELLAELRAIDATTLAGTPAAITHGFLTNQLESAIGHRACRIELWNVSPTWTGWQSELALLAGSQPVVTSDQREMAAARFSEVPAYLDTEIDNLREGVRLGYTAPKNNVRAVIEQVDAMLAAPLGDSPFVQIAGEDGPPEFRAQMEQLEIEKIRPAIQRYRDYLDEEYLPVARVEIAVTSDPGGLECYRAALRRYTTAALTAQQVHEMGLAQMELIRAEMKTIGKRSFGTGDIAELLERATTEPEYRLESREALIDAARDAVARAKAATPDWFGRVPTAEVIVRPYPAYQEKSAPGGFYNSPPAAGGPGVYLINAYEAEKQSRAGLESTAFHEAYPGHHLQASIALEIEGLHRVAKYFYLSGFGEGWALYSERLADEMGLFSDDIDRLGLLSNEALRAARLVVDSGMHALGWSRQRAIDYLLANTASTESQTISEIDRYIAVPGQATSYMVGNLEIRRLREEAEAALGEAFDIKKFHDRVLEDGSVPLWLLREKIESWIAGR